MTNPVETHYSGSEDLTGDIVAALVRAGKSIDELRPEDLAAIDEFHIRGRQATLELAEKMELDAAGRVIDIGSGLGGPARTVAQVHGCHVTGIDLTRAFCQAATAMSGWVGLADRVEFIHGDATDLPFADNSFDAAMTIHVGMNIAAKDKVYGEAKRVLRRGGIFAIYDVLQGEGGEVFYPTPWAREPSISHLATGEDMVGLIKAAGLELIDTRDSTAESQDWFDQVAERLARSGGPAVTFRAFLGDDFAAMAANQVRNLGERRIRTVSFICRA